MSFALIMSSSIVFGQVTMQLESSIKSRLYQPLFPKQGLRQVYIQPPKEIKHPYYKVAKTNDQHLFDLLHIPRNDFEGNTYKNILAGVKVASRYKAVRALKSKKSSKNEFVMETIYKIINIHRHFKLIMCLSLKVIRQGSLKITILTFKEQ